MGKDDNRVENSVPKNIKGVGVGPIVYNGNDPMANEPTGNLIKV